MSEHLMKMRNLRKDPTSKYYVEKEELQILPIRGFVYGLKKIDEKIQVPMHVINVTLAKQMLLKENDTFITGYPKSGTTWVEEICWLIQHNLNFELSRSKFHLERVMYIDDGISHVEMEELASPRIFKSHFPVKMLPDGLSVKAKVIYCIRNPKDMIASTFKFIKCFTKEGKYEGDFEDMVDLFLKGKYWFGSWWDHVNEFTSLPNVHIIHYESLLKNPKTEINLLAKFLGKELSENQLNAIIEYTTFDSMKNEKSLDFFKHYVNLDFFAKDSKFFSKGKMGYWPDYFSQELSAQFDKIIQEKLSYKGEISYF